MTASSYRHIRRVVGLIVIVAATLWAGFAAVTATSNAADDTLAAAALAHQRFFGGAVAASKLEDVEYVDIVNTEFNSITPGNEMKWDSTEPFRGSFDFGPADQIIGTLGGGKKLHGHVLVWHEQLPDWVKGLTDAGDLQAAMDDHINGVMGHYLGRVDAWDVVNEAFNDDGSRRQTLFQDLMGDGFIEHAFRTAREADPGAKLCYNDFNMEGGNAKSDAVYAMVQDFKNRGVPIDCVGFQTHLGSAPSDFASNLERFAALGVDVQLTEVDVGGASPETYSQVVEACLAVSRCTGMTVWGIRDSDNWRGGSTVLFDEEGGKKEAYMAVMRVLKQATTL